MSSDLEAKSSGLTDPPLILKNLFFQADTIKGYRFFDESGRLLNILADFYEQVSNGLEGLRLTYPKPGEQHPHSLRVAPNQIWFQFADPDSFSRSMAQTLELLRDISRILGVESYSRLGLRAGYYFPTSLSSSIARTIERRVISSSLLPEYPTERFEADFHIQLRALSGEVSITTIIATAKLAKHRESDETPLRGPGLYPADGIGFDVDAYRLATTQVNEVRQFLANARSAIENAVALAGQHVFGEAND